MGQKSRRCLILVIAAVLVLLIAGVVGYFLWQQSNSAVPAGEGPVSSAASSMELAQAASEPETSSTVEPAAPTSAVSVLETPPTVQEIQLSTNQVSLTVGQRQMPIVTMLPAQAPDKGEIWTSSDPSVATVSDLGSIYGVAEGSCTVTVTSSANPAVSAQVAVTVSPAPAPSQPVEETPTSSATSSGNQQTFLIRSYYWDYSYGLNEDGTYTLYWDDGHQTTVSKEELDAMEDEAFQQAHPPQTFY